MLDDKRLFYEKMVRDSLKGIKTRRSNNTSNRLVGNNKNYVNNKDDRNRVTTRNLDANRSTKNIENIRDIRNYTNRSTGSIRSNRSYTRNGMINFDEENSNTKSNFVKRCIICFLIVGGFYYLASNNPIFANKIIEPTKSILSGDFKTDSNKVTNVFLNFGNEKVKKDSVVIDNEVIEQMEKEIEAEDKIKNLKKK